LVPADPKDDENHAAFSAGSLWAAVAKRLQISPPTRQGLVNTQYEKRRCRY